MLFLWPVVIGPRPIDGTKLQLALWAKKGLLYVLVDCVMLVGAALGAIRVMKLQRQEYRVKLEQNIRDLVEGSIRDHEQKSD